MTDLVERLRRDGIKYQTDTFDAAADRIEADAAKLDKAKRAMVAVDEAIDDQDECEAKAILKVALKELSQ